MRLPGPRSSTGSHAPFQVAGDGAIGQTLVDHSEGPVADVAAPGGLGLQPLPERLLETGEEQEVVLGVPLHRRGAADLGDGVDEIDRVEGPAAIVALVTACLAVTAVGAGPLDVAVGEEPVRLRVVELAGGSLLEVPVLEE